MNTQISMPRMFALDRGFSWDVCFLVVLLTLLCAASHFVSGRGASAIVTQAILLSGFILISCLEHILPIAGPRKPARRWWMHLHLTVANSAIGILIFAFLGSYLANAIADKLGINLGLFDLTIDKSYGVMALIITGILGAITADFFNYWIHRAMHKSTFLWQHHKMHHIDSEFDAVTALRFNWFEYVLAGTFTVIPIAILFKFDDTSSFVDAGFVNGLVLYALWMSKVINHSNLRIQFGKASFLWISSQTHRIHHSRLPEHHDKNFAGYFPLWDVLFGTYYAPRWNEFPPTGVEGEKDIESFWEAQIFPFREWWKMFRAWQSRRKTFST